MLYLQGKRSVGMDSCATGHMKAPLSYQEHTMAVPGPPSLLRTHEGRLDVKTWYNWWYSASSTCQRLAYARRHRVRYVLLFPCEMPADAVPLHTWIRSLRCGSDLCRTAVKEAMHKETVIRMQWYISQSMRACDWVALGSALSIRAKCGGKIGDVLNRKL